MKRPAFHFLTPPYLATFPLSPPLLRRCSMRAYACLATTCIFSTGRKTRAWREVVDRRGRVREGGASVCGERGRGALGKMEQRGNKGRFIGARGEKTSGRLADGRGVHSGASRRERQALDMNITNTTDMDVRGASASAAPYVHLKKGSAGYPLLRRARPALVAARAIRVAQ